MKIWMILVLLLVLVTPWEPARAESDQQTIVFGQSAALTGPARALGIGMRLGLHAGNFPKLIARVASRSPAPPRILGRQIRTRSRDCQHPHPD